MRYYLTTIDKHGRIINSEITTSNIDDITKLLKANVGQKDDLVSEKTRIFTRVTEEVIMENIGFEMCNTDLVGSSARKIMKNIAIEKNCRVQSVRDKVANKNGYDIEQYCLIVTNCIISHSVEELSKMVSNSMSIRNKFNDKIYVDEWLTRIQKLLQTRN